MAASHYNVTEVREEHRNIADCNICCETCRDPRMLPCLHTFCLSCISQAGTEANSRSGDKMPCPLCRKELIIQTSDFEGLKKNFFIQRMIEMLQRTSAEIPCDTCNDETNNELNPIAIAARHCTECNMNLCEQCCAHHRRSRLTREHTLRKGASLTNSRESEEALDLRMCRIHADEEMKLYCRNCLDVLCPMCFIENHQGHERLSVVEAGDDFRRQIQVTINDIDECTSNATMKKELIERETERITERTEQLEKEVIKKRDDLKKLVDKHAEIIMEQLRTRESEKLKKVAIQNDDTKRHLVSLESYKSYITSFVVNATNGEICRMVSDLKARATELRKENNVTVQCQLSPYQLSFNATKLHNFSRLVENIIGNIEDADNEEPGLTSEENAIDENTETSDVTSQAEGYAAGTSSAEEKMKIVPGKKLWQSPVLIQTLKSEIAKEAKTPIWGVTCLNNRLYVVARGRPLVDVYDLMSLSLILEWEIDELKNPQDITSCAKDNCVYIMDWTLAQILRVIHLADRLLITEWSVPEGGGRLSVTQESNVLFTAYQQNKLSEYNADGHLICDIELSSEDGLVHPQHALKLSNGHFVISHGAVTDSLHRVCIIDCSGKVLRSFGGEAGSTVGRVNLPLHLAINSEGGILVADWNNSRVLLLNSQLEYDKELLSKRDGLRHPGRICLNESNGQLILADNHSGWSDGQVLIYGI